METTTTIDQAIQQITSIHKSLPPRPTIEEIEAAKVLIHNIDKEDQSRFDSISKQFATNNSSSSKNSEVPDELFMILQDMQKNLVMYQSNEQKKEALKVLDLENIHSIFDDLIQRTYRCCLPDYVSSKSSYSTDSVKFRPSSNLSSSSVATDDSGAASVYSGSGFSEQQRQFAKDDTYVKKAKPSLYATSTDVIAKPQIVDSSLYRSSNLGQDGEKLSLIRLASLIEVSAKKGARDLNLQNKLMDQIEWLPDSIGKLSSLITLDLSENRILALPATIGNLSSLTKLDLHCNKISELPQSIGDLLTLVVLDLRGNQIASLPSTFGRLIRLEDLDLSSNNLSVLPETIGSLNNLKILNIEYNNIEEIIHTIGQCSSLVKFRADYNRLKALPEAMGKIESLEILSVRYNNLKQLPTTMSSLVNLRELDVSFNELESVPESLCFATTLVKMNIGNNFADMRSLPRSIGNLEMLEELDISNNQIRILPDSFRMLTRLRILRVEENPLEVPPRNIAEKGAQAVVQYMEELVAMRNVKLQPVKQKSIWGQICCFSKSNKRKRSGTGNDFVIDDSQTTQMEV